MQEDGMQRLRIAFRQKGRCEMKLFEIPMVVTSLLGLCFLPDPQVPAARADFTFGPRVVLGPTVNSPQQTDVGAGHVSRDGLELYFASNRPGGYGDFDIWMTKRATVEDPWGPAVNLGPGINTVNPEGPLGLSSDGLTLYMSSSVGGYGETYTATRPTRDAPWSPRVNLGPDFAQPFFMVISPDDLELYFGSNRPGGLGSYDIYVSTRATCNAPWGPPENLGPTFNTAGLDAPTAMSPDGLILFIGAMGRPGGFGGADTWMARRPFKGAAWSAPVNLGPSFNTPNHDILTCVSSDGRWAYIEEYTVGPVGVWIAPILPIVDFNGDGKVDLVDLVMLIDDWGTDKTLCDIGPMPWGDGKVDIEDLKVFMTYYEKENPPAKP
jgi:hypothetical protein